MTNKARKVFIDGIEAVTLITSKLYYSWFTMKDGSVRACSTFSYDRENRFTKDIFLSSVEIS